MCVYNPSSVLSLFPSLLALFLHECAFAVDCGVVGCPPWIGWCFLVWCLVGLAVLAVVGCTYHYLHLSSALLPTATLIHSLYVHLQFGVALGV